MPTRLRPSRAPLREIVAQAIDELRHAPCSKLTSVSLTLPPGVIPLTPELSVDTFWRAPGGGGEVLARGNAMRIADAGPGEFARWASGWKSIGEAEAGCLPQAFFTVPALSRPAMATICWPALQVCRSPHSDVVTFTAARATPPDETARRWTREWSAFLSPTRAREPAGAVVCHESMTPRSDEWLSAVEATRAEIALGRFQKAVLARRLTLELQTPVDPLALARRLAQDHPSCHVFAIPYDGGHVAAASPERLAVKSADIVVCDALAGTVRRSGCIESDDRESASLLACSKQRHEHALVVRGLAAALAGISSGIEMPREPRVKRLRSMFHLWTEITAQLQPGHGLLDVVTRLHPTAAVAGYPFESAKRWLETLGEQRDGLYTGVAGCIDRRGDGEAVVVLRSAHVKQRSAVLWAGAGIVAGSQPLSELHEIDLKLDTMREALSCA